MCTSNRGAIHLSMSIVLCVNTWTVFANVDGDMCTLAAVALKGSILDKPTSSGYQQQMNLQA